jgi:hypothetical protein
VIEKRPLEIRAVSMAAPNSCVPKKTSEGFSAISILDTDLVLIKFVKVFCFFNKKSAVQVVCFVLHTCVRES